MFRGFSERLMKTDFFMFLNVTFCSSSNVFHERWLNKNDNLFDSLLNDMEFCGTSVLHEIAFLLEYLTSALSPWHVIFSQPPLR